MKVHVFLVNLGPQKSIVVTLLMLEDSGNGELNGKGCEATRV